jgi:transposase
MQKYKITKEQAKEIRRRIKNYEKTPAFRKLQAVMLMGEGIGVHTVAAITLYHHKRIYELVKQYCTKSFETFVKEQRGGVNHKNLTDSQEAAILDKFKEKAEKGEIVSLGEMKQEYERVRGKETANSTFYNFLDRVKWRRVMPRGQHPKKASNEAIEASKKLTLNTRK